MDFVKAGIAGFISTLVFHQGLLVGALILWPLGFGFGAVDALDAPRAAAADRASMNAF